MSGSLARCGRVVMFGLSIALGSVGCGPGIILDESMSAQDTGSTAASATTVAPDDGPVTSGPVASVGVSTGADTTSDGDTLDDDDDQCCSFYAGAPDNGGTIWECSPIAQDCALGEKCMPWSNDGTIWNATRCVPIPPDPAQLGEPCTVVENPVSGLDDCDLGLMCWEVDPKTNEGICEDMCTGNSVDPSCADDADVCAVSNDGAITLCLPGCDPLMQDCAEDEGCYPTDLHEFACWSTLDPDTIPGDSCLDLNGCAAGQVCMSDSRLSGCKDLSCCTPYCALDDPDADTTCAALNPGHVCTPAHELGIASMEDETLGVCALPQ